MSGAGTIGLEIDADGVARAVIDRPQARNAFTFAMYERLAEICAQIDADERVRVLVLSGAGGKAFAAGTDIAEFRALETPQDVIDYEARIDRVLGALERVRVPTIAMIAGACTGGGAAIAASCDLRIAEAGARIGFPIARTLGNCLSMRNLARLVRLVGEARVKNMVFTARLLDAHEAQRVGFLGEVLSDAAALEAHVASLARTIAGHAPLTLAATKEALARLRAGVPHGADEDLVVACYTSADFKEGMEAFLAKRPPRFTGR